MKKTRRTGGFSLVEVVIAMAILAIVMAMVYMSLFSSSAEYEANAKRAWILHQARLALDEMAEDIRESNRWSVLPTGATTGNSMSFKKAKSPDLTTGSAVYTTDYITYRLDKSDDTQTVTDTVNSKGPYNLPGAVTVDADNNSSTTEGRIVRIDPNPDDNGRTYPARIMCNYVKNSTNAFQITQSMATIGGNRQLQVEISITLVFTDARNKVLEETLSTKIFLRNSQ